MISLKHSIINLKFHVLNAVREESIRNISSCLFAELLNLPSAILSLSSSIFFEEVSMPSHQNRRKPFIIRFCTMVKKRTVESLLQPRGMHGKSCRFGGWILFWEYCLYGRKPENNRWNVVFKYSIYQHICGSLASEKYGTDFREFIHICK